MKHNAPTTDVTHTDLAHESAVKHVTGRANYTDDNFIVGGFHKLIAFFKVWQLDNINRFFVILSKNR